ncbi:hypothetical protein [Actinoplanes friuliensis]|nr:hypothetical protein [Actinoplanes friuliensis]
MNEVVARTGTAEKVWRSLAYCAVLIPVALGALVVGRGAAGWWRALRTRLLQAAPVAEGRPGTGAVAVHAVQSLLLGVAALIPLGMQVLMVLRGALYGFVDPGPYDTSWGGPTRGGAWAAHFLISVPLSLAGLALLVGIAAMHQRLTASLDGERRARWLTPVTAGLCVAGGLFLVGWVRQI